MSRPTAYRTVDVGGLPIFYREAGDPDAPAILLLHGLPSSSRMYQPLLDRLSDRYRLVAPDYPGFGHSAAPDPSAFAYTFNHIAEVMIRLTEVLAIPRYNLFMQDYGGPVGFQMAMAHPERVESMIVQNAVAHDTASARYGLRGVPSGQTGRRMRRRCARTCCRWRQPADATSAAIRITSAMIPTCGRTSSPFSAVLGRRISRQSCSTTTATTWPPIQGGSDGCKRTNLVCWCFGADTTRRSTYQSPNLTGAMYPMRRFKF